MKSFSRAIIGVFLSAVSIEAVCVDESRLWLPKSLQGLQPKLLVTAVDAEKTERCTKVISGRLNPEQTTAQDYFFVVTCRDEDRRSYNLSYRYPVTGSGPVLVNEQKSMTQKKILEEEEIVMPEGKPVITIDPPTAERAWKMCINVLTNETRNMLEVSVQDDPRPAVKQLEMQKQFYMMNFDAKNPQGATLRYSAQCTVPLLGRAKIKIQARKD